MNPTKYVVLLGTILVSGQSFAQNERLIESGKPGQTATPATAVAAPVVAPAAEPAAEPDVNQETSEPGTAPKRAKASVASAGLSTQDVTIGGGSGATAGEDWGFKFKGFFRGPMRLGMSQLGNGSSKLQLRAPPAVPDGNFTKWSFTNVSPGPWAELLFQYGNARAMMTTSIASYNITSGGWRELQDQLGIDRAFVTLKFPEALGDLGGLAWDVGVFSNRYGAMGKYDAGAYETYIIGRTRVAGETLTADLALNDDLTLIIEHGIGAKMDQQKWVQQAAGKCPDGSYGTSFGQGCSFQTWEPYPGAKQQGTTLLHHAHAGLNIKGMVTVMAHYLEAWTRDARVTGAEPDGQQRVLGLDLRLDGGWLGDGYLGFSQVKAKNVFVVSDVIEVIHSQGGWQLANNYTNIDGNAANLGNGTISTVGFQYSGSLAAYMTQQPFWGDGADVSFKVFGMYTKVSSIPDDVASVNGKSKLKFGTEVIYSPLPFLAAGARFDSVQPNLSNSYRSFMVFSPKLILRTEFVTHEVVTIQYSYYSNNKEVVSFEHDGKIRANLPFPYGQYGPWETLKADKHVLTVSATMWW